MFVKCTEASCPTETGSGVEATAERIGLHSYVLISGAERSLLPPTGSFGLPWCWHPRVSRLLHRSLSPLRRTWSRVHGAGDEREPRPGRPDAAGPQGWIPDGRDAGRVHGDPGRSGPGGRTPARDHPAGPAPGTSRWGSPVRSRSPGRRRCGCPARPHPNPAVTLSDMGGRGERSPSRRYDRISA